MAKEATLQVRMDAELKDKVEALYRDMGTSFAEAVRIFARQSVRENGCRLLLRQIGTVLMDACPNMRMLNLWQRKKAHMKRRW